VRRVRWNQSVWIKVRSRAPRVLRGARGLPPWALARATGGTWALGRCQPSAPYSLTTFNVWNSAWPGDRCARNSSSRE